MRKLFSLMLAAALTFAPAWRAGAVEVKVSGTMDFAFEYTGNLGNTMTFANTFMDSDDVAAQGKEFHQKHRTAVQRLILGAQFIVSENLSACYDAILGYFTWGGPVIPGAYPPQQQGGALGSRAANIITRQAYLDWIIPSTSIKIRMGQQMFFLPSFANGNPAMASEFGTGITMHAPINDRAGLTAIWVRVNSEPRRGTASSLISHVDDTLDLFALLVPLRFQGGQAIPWVGMAVAGKGGITYAQQAGTAMEGGRLTPLQSAAAAGSGRAVADADAGLSTSTMWWGGFSGEASLFDPFRFGLDLYYSDNGQREKAYQRKGWYAGAAASYKTAWGVPTLKGWYASGDDGDVNNGSERPLYVNGGFAMTGAAVMFTNTTGNIERTFECGMPGGTWGVSAQWNNLSLVENLFQSLRVTYVKGTNSSKMAPYANPNYIFQYLTDKDSLVEIDLDSTYSIYKNLSATLMLSYLLQDFDENLWTNAARASHIIGADKHIRFSNAWRASLLFRYAF